MTTSLRALIQERLRAKIERQEVDGDLYDEANAVLELPKSYLTAQHSSGDTTASTRMEPSGCIPKTTSSLDDLDSDVSSLPGYHRTSNNDSHSSGYCHGSRHGRRHYSHGSLREHDRLTAMESPSSFRSRAHQSTVEGGSQKPQYRRRHLVTRDVEQRWPTVDSNVETNDFMPRTSIPFEHSQRQRKTREASVVFPTHYFDSGPDPAYRNGHNKMAETVSDPTHFNCSRDSNATCEGDEKLLDCTPRSSHVRHGEYGLHSRFINPARITRGKYQRMLGGDHEMGEGKVYAWHSTHSALSPLSRSSSSQPYEGSFDEKRYNSNLRARAVGANTLFSSLEPASTSPRLSSHTTWDDTSRPEKFSNQSQTRTSRFYFSDMGGLQRHQSSYTPKSNRLAHTGQSLVPLDLSAIDGSNKVKSVDDVSRVRVFDEILSPDSKRAAEAFVEKRQKRASQGTPRTMATHRWLQSMLDAAPTARSVPPKASLLSPVEAALIHGALR